MNRHELKAHSAFFADVVTGRKPFELRFDDRGYRVGDLLLLREWVPEQEVYTGWAVEVLVLYILRGFEGMREGWVAMSIKVTEIYPPGSGPAEKEQVQ